MEKRVLASLGTLGAAAIRPKQADHFTNVWGVWALSALLK